MGDTINAETGRGGPGQPRLGGIDSYYEYLYKSWLLFADPDFKLMWDSSIVAVNRYLLDQRPSGWWYGHADMDTGRRTLTHFGALDAFVAALLAKSGDEARAGRLMQSIYSMWTTFGIEPEELDYVTMQPTSPGYVLRPEAIESAYYLYRITGERRWQEMGRVMVDSLLHYTRTDAGFAALTSAVTKEKRDQMESFFLAETLKYAYSSSRPRRARLRRGGVQHRGSIRSGRPGADPDHLRRPRADRARSPLCLLAPAFRRPRRLAPRRGWRAASARAPRRRPREPPQDSVSVSFHSQAAHVCTGRASRKCSGWPAWHSTACTGPPHDAGAGRADGCRVIYSLPGLLPGFAGRRVLVAAGWTAAPSRPPSAPSVLIAPEDGAEHARWSGRSPRSVY